MLRFRFHFHRPDEKYSFTTSPNFLKVDSTAAKEEWYKKSSKIHNLPARLEQSSIYSIYSIPASISSRPGPTIHVIIFFPTRPS